MAKNPTKHAASTTSMTTNETHEPAPKATTADVGFDALSSVAFPNVESQEQDEDAPHEIGGDGLPISDSVPHAKPQAERMTKDAFWFTFKGAFKIGSVLPFVGVPELAIAPDEYEHGRVASDAIYDLLEMYLPSFFDSDREVLGLLIAAGSFLIMKGMVVAAVIKARQAQQIAEMQAQQRQRQGQGDEFKTGRTPQPAQDFKPVEIVEWSA